jgi:hypothetical protein
MKVLNRLLQSLDSRQDRREIDDELRFHLDLLTDELCRKDIPRHEARDRAEARFGNIEKIRNQCLEISIRNSPQARALKSLLVLVFLTGVLVRVLGTEFHVVRMGTILIAVGLLGRLLLYVRGLSPSSFLSEDKDSSSLNLNDSQMSFTSYDQKMRTPLERVISSK